MGRQAIGEGQGSSTIKSSASLKNEISEQVVVQRNCGPRGLEMEAICSRPVNGVDFVWGKT